VQKCISPSGLIYSCFLKAGISDLLFHVSLARSALNKRTMERGHVCLSARMLYLQICSRNCMIFGACILCYMLPERLAFWSVSDHCNTHSDRTVSLFLIIGKWTRNLAFMEREGPLPCSQEPVTGPHHQPNESTLHSYPSSLKFILILLNELCFLDFIHSLVSQKHWGIKI
jgi:hypothetical protein